MALYPTNIVSQSWDILEWLRQSSWDRGFDMKFDFPLLFGFGPDQLRRMGCRCFCLGSGSCRYNDLAVVERRLFRHWSFAPVVLVVTLIVALVIVELLVDCCLGPIVPPHRNHRYK